MKQFLAELRRDFVLFLIFASAVVAIGAIFRPIHYFFGTEVLYQRKHDSQVFRRIERQLENKSQIKLAIVGSSVCYSGVNLEFFEAFDESEILYMCTSATSVSDVIQKSQIAADLVNPDWLLCEVSHRTHESLANEGRNRFIASAPLDVLLHSLPLCTEPFSPSRCYAILKRSLELYIRKKLMKPQSEIQPATHMCNDEIIPNQKQDLISTITVEQKVNLIKLKSRLSKKGTELILFQSPSSTRRDPIAEFISEIPVFHPTVTPDSCLPDNVHLTCECAENFSRELSEFVTTRIHK